jgi:hypothetical protein
MKIVFMQKLRSPQPASQSGNFSEFFSGKPAWLRLT